MDLGTSFRPEGAVKPSSLEVDSYEPDLSAKRSVEIPSNLHMEVDYDVRTDSNPVYVGFSPRNYATSATGWLLQKFTYDGSDRCTKREIAYDSWDNRAGASYG